MQYKIKILTGCSTYFSVTILFLLIDIIKIYSTVKTIIIIMASLDIKTLKQICDKLPDSYVIQVETSKGDIINLKEVIEVDISNDTLILKG